jgi:hypothetical protein
MQQSLAILFDYYDLTVMIFTRDGARGWGIEVGKRADFCLLEEDPLTNAPKMLKFVPIGVPYWVVTPSKCRMVWLALESFFTRMYKRKKKYIKENSFCFCV